MKKSQTTLKFKGIIIDAYETHYQTQDKTLVIEQVKHPGGVCIAARKRDGNFLMVKQYRFGIDDTLLEFPAGLIDPGELPQNTALRELQEETGYAANKIKDLGFAYLSPGYTDEVIHFFFAEDLTFVGTNFDENENIEISEMNLKALLTQCDNHSLVDAKTVTLTYKVARYLESKGE